MAKDGSVAPKERVNIRYIPQNGNAQSSVELPFKMLLTGDFKGYAEDIAIEDRRVIAIDKNNFDAVMQESNLTLQTTVKNKLLNDDTDLNIDLKIRTLQDFSPDAIATQIPEINKLIELRNALASLKAPLGNIPAFRKQLQEILQHEETRNKLLKELELN